MERQKIFNHILKGKTQKLNEYTIINVYEDSIEIQAHFMQNSNILSLLSAPKFSGRSRYEFSFDQLKNVKHGKTGLFSHSFDLLFENNSSISILSTNKDGIDKTVNFINEKIEKLRKARQAEAFLDQQWKKFLDLNYKGETFICSGDHICFDKTKGHYEKSIDVGFFKNEENIDVSFGTMLLYSFFQQNRIEKTNHYFFSKKSLLFVGYIDLDFVYGVQNKNEKCLVFLEKFANGGVSEFIVLPKKINEDVLNQLINEFKSDEVEIMELFRNLHNEDIERKKREKPIQNIDDAQTAIFSFYEDKGYHFICFYHPIESDASMFVYDSEHRDALFVNDKEKKLKIVKNIDFEIHQVFKKKSILDMYDVSTIYSFSEIHKLQTLDLLTFDKFNYEKALSLFEIEQINRSIENNLANLKQTSQEIHDIAYPKKKKKQKIDVGGMVVGGLVGGTAGAILGGQLPTDPQQTVINIYQPEEKKNRPNQQDYIQTKRCFKFYLTQQDGIEKNSIIVELNNKTEQPIQEFVSKLSLEKSNTDPNTDLPSNNETSSFELIKKYKELLDMDIITQDEFDQKKKELLNL